MLTQNEGKNEEKIITASTIEIPRAFNTLLYIVKKIRETELLLIDFYLFYQGCLKALKGEG